MFLKWKTKITPCRRTLNKSLKKSLKQLLKFASLVSLDTAQGYGKISLKFRICDEVSKIFEFVDILKNAILTI